MMHAGEGGAEEEEEADSSESLAHSCTGVLQKSDPLDNALRLANTCIRL